MGDRDMNDSRLTRRSLVRGTALGLAGAAAISSTHGAFAGGVPSRFFVPGLRQALSGEITVSYPDEAGKKPKYVQQAADNVTKANPDAKINIDLQKVDGGTYMTSLLLKLDSGDSPDVFHVGGDQIGALADAGYIDPHDAFLAK